MDNFIVKGWLSKYRYGYLRLVDEPNVWGVLTPTSRFIKARDQHERGALAEARLLRKVDA
jgi:hypothetical protein